ncbi:uncharacterized protein C11orf98 homolog [Xenia sp. Carnegie-2017]|uniref:uncharacterized protein C11orf98 homolog n=1 Tax=Xenia sp. Carnegie-2017 TaxID=2897299 RepID=UPI001F036D9F|nr:uncharacterized protein C11orf98 homolog [Xenia sp. Carnegie-2017]
MGKMSAGSGSSINHPKSAAVKSKRKRKKVIRDKNKKKKLSVDPLTTTHILRKTRTNPKANITLSGKKRRLLLKQLKRIEQEKKKMDIEGNDNQSSKVTLKDEETNNLDDEMDMS